MTQRPLVKDWHEDALYCAMDMSGEWFDYFDEPSILSGANKWNGSWCSEHNKCDNKPEMFWKDSLISREEALTLENIMFEPEEETKEQSAKALEEHYQSQEFKTPEYIKIGSFIEYNSYGKWHKCEIIALTDIDGTLSITITAPYCHENLAETFDLEFLIDNNMVRPVKSDKEKWIDEAVKACAPPVTSGVKSMDYAKKIINAIYDAGLAKMA